MINTLQFENGCFYHIYNRGNNSGIIFKEDANFLYFLILLKKHISPIAEIYTYCLLNNHFHLLIKIKENEDNKVKYEQSFSNLFNAYAKAYNKKYNRTGKLFEERFKKIKIDDEFYLTELIYYIHANPQKHGILKDFRDYKYSSYKTIISSKPTVLSRDEVIKWFGGLSFFIEYHLDRHFKLSNEKVEEFDI